MKAEVTYVIDGVIQTDRYQAARINWTMHPDGITTLTMLDKRGRNIGGATYGQVWRIRRGRAVP